MKQLLEKHPDLEPYLHSGSKTYKILAEDGSLLEQWEKNDAGHWIDVIQRELLKKQIADAQAELEKLKAKENK